MKAKTPHAKVLTTLAALLCLGSGPGCGAPEPRPNVLLYVVDTLRADGLEPYGNPVVPTPAAARLAREGVLYERAYAHSSWTRPSVASILTGQLPSLHGVEGRHDSASPSLRFIAETLSEAGYTTGAIVTNPNAGSFFGFDQGYGDFIELFETAGKGVVQSTTLRTRSDVVTERAIEWIDNAAPPFFLFVLTNDPHTPYEPPSGFDRFRGKTDPRPRGPKYEANPDVERQRSKYYGEIAFNDASFGRLLDHLWKTQRYDDTLIVLSSDHGEEFGEHGHRWHGKSLFDEQIQVPLIIRRPREPQPGRRVKTPVQLVDVYPTVLDAVGLRVPEGSPGNVLPPEKGAGARPVYARLELDGYSSEMLLAYPWKWIASHAQPGKDKRELGGLFDLEDDPFEATDHRDDRPEVVAELRGLIEQRRGRSRHPEDPQVTDEKPRELPPDVREALEVLGYLTPDEGPAQNTR